MDGEFEQTYSVRLDWSVTAPATIRLAHTGTLVAHVNLCQRGIVRRVPIGTYGRGRALAWASWLANDMWMRWGCADA